MADSVFLKNQWDALWHQIQWHSGDDASHLEFFKPGLDEYFNDMVARYSEPHRAYHTLDHIEECMKLTDSKWDLFTRPTDFSRQCRVKLALVYHDVVYNTRSHTNEYDSACHVRSLCNDLFLNPQFGYSVGRLILSTVHTKFAHAGEDAFVCDIDLARLADSPEDFDRNSADIRFEYSWVPETMYLQNRKKVLQSFLDRRRIFAYLGDDYEKRAQENLKRAISELS